MRGAGWAICRRIRPRRRTWISAGGEPATPEPPRIRLLLVCSRSPSPGLFSRAVWLQAVHARGLDRIAQGQRHATVAVPAPRGAMVDRNGVQLAIGRRATTVYANPKHIADPRAAAIAAGRALRLDPDKLYGPLADQSRGFVYVARKADAKRADALQRKGIQGLGFYSEERRVSAGLRRRPRPRVRGVDNKGLSGLELALNETLAGRPGRETVVRDPFGRALDILKATPAVEGRDVRLTLDATLQANASPFCARRCAAGVRSPRPPSSSTRTAARCSHWPSSRASTQTASRRPRAVQRNRAVTDTYEPGSTLKVVTVAGALSEGLVSPTTQFTPRTEDPGSRPRDPRRRTEPTYGADDGCLDPGAVLNIGTITLAQLLGRERLTSWLGKFGFGRKTGIDFPGETQRILPNYWSGSTIRTLPIGHGIAVTPVQMAAAYAAVANGGVWRQPHLVLSSRIRQRRVISPVPSPSSADVDDARRRARGHRHGGGCRGYRVAGKTGTAAKPDPRGGYSTSRFVALVRRAPCRPATRGS